MAVSNTFRADIEKGEKLFQNGKVAEALEVFESVLAREPGHVVALNNKGVSLNSLGRYREAIRVFSEALRIDDSHSDSAFNLIANHIAIGEWDNAREAFYKYKQHLAQRDVDMIQKDLEKNAPVREKAVRPMVCAICRSPDLKGMTTNRSFGVEIVECLGCGFVQSEYVSESAIREYYTKYYRPPLSREEIYMLRKKSHAQAVSQMAYINTLVPGVKFDNAFDYGTGDGELAKLLKEISGAVYVTEFDPQYVALLKKDSDLVLLDERDLDRGDLDRFFDFISLSHVLEHQTDPMSALERFSRLLKKEGMLLVDLPNELELLTRVNFQAKGHLSYFTINSFKQLVKIHGKFDILEIRTCNRSVEEFIASGLRLSEQYFRSNTPNGTVIRALLSNVRPDNPFDRRPNDFIDAGLLLDEYSRRLLYMYQHLARLENEKLRGKRN